MKAIPAKVRKAVLDADRKSGRELAEAQKSLVPVDDGVLRDAIVVTSITEPDRTGVYVSVRGKPVFYSLFVELGTANNKAQPFFYPVYRAYKRRIRARRTRALRKALKK